MSMIPDLSDCGLVRQFGDIMHELPELYEALRRFEIESRPVRGGFKVSMKGADKFGMRIGNPRGEK